MRWCVFTEPQFGADHDQLLRVARHAEELGFEAFFRSDHYLTMGGDGLPGPTDSWVSLGALAVQTSRIRLGTLVTSATFRLPGPLAISVAQVDQMSGGRVEMGLGSGWFAAEHTAYGIPFPPLGERFDRLAEQLEIVTGLWRTPVGSTYSFAGKHYQVNDSPGLPKPAQAGGPPVIVGGRGPRRTPSLAARFADEFNVPFASVTETAEMYSRVRDAAAAERVPEQDPLVFSAAQTVAVGRTDAEARRRTDAIGQVPPLSGTPDQVVQKIGEYAEAGAARMFLQVLDLDDLDQLDLIASAVLPQFA